MLREAGQSSRGSVQQRVLFFVCTGVCVNARCCAVRSAHACFSIPPQLNPIQLSLPLLPPLQPSPQAPQRPSNRTRYLIEAGPTCIAGPTRRPEYRRRPVEVIEEVTEGPANTGSQIADAPIRRTPLFPRHLPLALHTSSTPKPAIYAVGNAKLAKPIVLESIGTLLAAAAAMGPAVWTAPAIPPSLVVQATFQPGHPPPFRGGRLVFWDTEWLRVSSLRDRFLRQRLCGKTGNRFPGSR
ncbi:hypothetical protein FN846DRAFT_250263 [Sphaerosporella brunnea]|uniref:Uncharacterized protein n=1 Tax=Sphaerosporella brunnea TaxID=1250544 RepID=A0A5J5FBA4_9PEZI|nr:hypothetical protein FN846DRAFT_250263 [Sphaerosporella brunnea]